MDNSTRKLRRRSIRNIRRSSSNFHPLNTSVLEPCFSEDVPIDVSAVAQSYGSAWMGNENIDPLSITTDRWTNLQQSASGSKNFTSVAVDSGVGSCSRHVGPSSPLRDLQEKTNTFQASNDLLKHYHEHTRAGMSPTRDSMEQIRFSKASDEHTAVQAVCLTSGEVHLLDSPTCSLPALDLNQYGSVYAWLGDEANATFSINSPMQLDTNHNSPALQSEQEAMKPFANSVSTPPQKESPESVHLKTTKSPIRFISGNSGGEKLVREEDSYVDLNDGFVDNFLDLSLSSLNNQPGLTNTRSSDTSDEFTQPVDFRKTSPSRVSEATSSLPINNTEEIWSAHGPKFRKMSPKEDCHVLSTKSHNHSDSAVSETMQDTGESPISSEATIMYMDKPVAHVSSIDNALHKKSSILGMTMACAIQSLTARLEALSSSSETKEIPKSEVRASPTMHPHAEYGSNSQNQIFNPVTNFVDESDLIHPYYPGTIHANSQQSDYHVQDESARKCPEKNAAVPEMPVKMRKRLSLKRNQSNEIDSTNTEVNTSLAKSESKHSTEGAEIAPSESLDQSSDTPQSTVARRDDIHIIQNIPEAANVLRSVDYYSSNYSDLQSVGCADTLVESNISSSSTQEGVQTENVLQDDSQICQVDKKHRRRSNNFMTQESIANLPTVEGDRYQTISFDQREEMDNSSKQTSLSIEDAEKQTSHDSNGPVSTNERRKKTEKKQSRRRSKRLSGNFTLNEDDCSRNRLCEEGLEEAMTVEIDLTSVGDLPMAYVSNTTQPNSQNVTAIEQYHFDSVVLDPSVTCFSVHKEDMDFLVNDNISSESSDVCDSLTQHRKRTRSQRTCKRKSWVLPQASDSSSAISKEKHQGGSRKGKIKDSKKDQSKDIEINNSQDDSTENFEVNEELEQLYRNKQYQAPPATRPWETIKENPKNKIDVFSKQRRPRMLTFQEGFTQPRMVKRHRKAAMVSKNSETKPVSITDEDFSVRMTSLDKLMADS